MTKKLEVIDVIRMSGSQLQMLLYPGRIHALYSDTVDGQPYMICLIDANHRHNLPVVNAPEIYAGLFAGQLSPGIEVSDEEYDRILASLHNAQIEGAEDVLLRNVLATQH